MGSRRGVVAQRMRGMAVQNSADTLAVDAVGIGLAAVGRLDPLLATLIHVPSTLDLILGSTRLPPPPRHD